MCGYREDDYLAECILSRAHNSPHIFKTPEGKFFAWEDDECDCCEPEEDDPCAIYWEIRESEIPNLSKKQV
jgi:hypothetical protein